MLYYNGTIPGEGGRHGQPYSHRRRIG